MSNFSQSISDLNSALFPNQNRADGTLLKQFGGESYGFSKDLAEKYAESFYQNSSVADEFSRASGMNLPIPRSIFNQYALFNYRGFYGGLTGDVSKFYRDENGPNTLHGGSFAHNVSIGRLIEYFGDYYPKIAYKPQDFIYCKYYNKIPINHLITLRRFPLPTNDNIYSYSVGGGEDSPKSEIDATQVAGVTAVTYMGETAGNKLDEILKFNYGLNWEEITSKMETIDTQDGGYTSQPFYNKSGSIGRALIDTTKGINTGDKFRRQSGNGSQTGDRLSATYPNFVLGPVNVINKTTIRNIGLNFSNDITLSFEYELKSLNYVNPKIAMIDLISNMLTMTTNNAQFFGGGHRYYGSAGFVASQFGDPNKLRNGDFSGYIGSVVRDVESGFKGAFGDGNGGFTAESLLKGGLKTGKNLLGNLLGGFLNSQVGAISGTQATAAFISAEPTGNWHLTIGNPLNPIAMMGNMYCDTTTMTLGSGLGYDDFPMEVKFDITLKHGKPRDKGDIENMFNGGNGRIYASAADEADILNLQGIDVKTYGAIQDVGTYNLQQTQAGSVQSNATNANSPGDISPTNLTGNAIKSGSSESAEYVSNLVSMFIDG